MCLFVIATKKNWKMHSKTTLLIIIKNTKILENKCNENIHTISILKTENLKTEVTEEES